MAPRGNVVHVVGTGTIGEPLVGLLSQYRKELGIDEVTFYKHSAKAEHVPLMRALQQRGARMAVQDGRRADFEKLGVRAELSAEQALERARVIIDCTPGDAGMKKVYQALDDGERTFLAQGGEKDDWGVPFALGINEPALKDEPFVQVVSCNTHNISALLKSIAFKGQEPNLAEGRFVCIRRSGDVGDEKIVAAPAVDKHKEALGTHHATDVHRVFTTLGHDLNLFSSALKLPTQYMHTIWFDLKLKSGLTQEQVAQRVRDYPYLAVTQKRQTNLVFSHGREWGPFGRILNQGVVSLPSLQVRGNEVVGFCFTPQDGNVLLSNMALAARACHGDKGMEERLPLLRSLLFREC